MKGKKVYHRGARTELSRSAHAAEIGDAEGFFLPNPCQNEALLLIVLAAELFALLITLIKSGMIGFDWGQLALISVLVQAISLSSAFVLCRLRPWLLRLPSRRAVAIAFAVVPTLTWLLDGLAMMLLHAPNRDSLALWWSDEVLRDVAVSILLTGMVFRYFYLQAQLAARQQAELRHQLQALQSRIQPHFLFNSMNSIASLITIDPVAAEQAVEDLSALFRASLSEVGNQVPLSTELDLCRRYLRIEQLRFGKRLRVHWALNLASEDVLIPLLTLQPLLENAIVHGIAPLQNGGEIQIECIQQRGLLEIKVVNPNPAANSEAGTPEEGANEGGNQMALANIRSRLSVLYGSRAKLAAYAEKGRYICHLSYPVSARRG
ncbi:Sensor histidine kinase [gamma proteobacterium HdN1]|nr:Sensor histidine kinase [gamma proteobacterium HdN1]